MTTMMTEVEIQQYEKSLRFWSSVGGRIIKFIGSVLAVTLTASSLVAGISKILVKEWVSEQVAPLQSQVNELSMRVSAIVVTEEGRHQALDKNIELIHGSLSTIQDRVEFLYQNAITEH